jgi:hypothetical protein
MRAGLHDVSDDGFLAQLLARLQTMQAFHQDETFAVLPHEDRALQADLEDALGDLLRFLGIERRAPFHRHVDVGDRERLALHHGWQPGVRLLTSADPSSCTSSGRLLRTPTRRIRSPCCARAANGHAAGAPPSSDINARRLIGHPSSDLGPHITIPLRKNTAVHHSKNCALMLQMGQTRSLQ